MQDIVLICTPLQFYTQQDEDALFMWLKAISSIKDIYGRGKELHVVVDINKLTCEDLKNFIAIFDRYRFNNMSQLKVFKNKENQYIFDALKERFDA